jgi:integrase
LQPRSTHIASRWLLRYPTYINQSAFDLFLTYIAPRLHNRFVTYEELRKMMAEEITEVGHSVEDRQYETDSVATNTEHTSVLSCDKVELPQVRSTYEAAVSGDLDTLRDTTAGYIRSSKATNTRRAYRADWDHFTIWCTTHSFGALPAAAETVAMYAAALAEDHKVATITRRLAAISQAHQAAGYESPCKVSIVQAAMAGIRRSKGTAPATKTPTLTDDIRMMVAATPSTLLGARDRALLLVGFAGAFRRLELVGIDRCDLEITPEGLVVALRRSKTDQEGQGRKVAIPYGSHPQTCPVRALEAWLQASGIGEGAVFRPVNRHGRIQPGRLSGYAVAIVVKRYAEASGLDPAKFAGHSLRAGLATAAAIGGASERAIMAQTGHRSTAMVRRYIRDGNLFRENAAAKVGL